MGKCVKCRRETNNKYIYYTANLTNHIEYEVAYSKNISDTYNNFELHEDFVCSKCALLLKLIVRGLLACLGVFFIVMFFKDIILGKEKFLEGIIIGIIFSLLGIFFIIRFILQWVKVVLDKPVSDSWGSYILTVFMERKRDSLTFVYFSIDSFNKLKKQNI